MTAQHFLESRNSEAKYIFYTKYDFFQNRIVIILKNINCIIKLFTVNIAEKCSLRQKRLGEKEERENPTINQKCSSADSRRFFRDKRI